MEGTREAILCLHRAGKTQTDIADKLSVAQSTVSKAIKRYYEHGTFKDLFRSGRPRIKRK